MYNSTFFRPIVYSALFVLIWAMPLSALAEGPAKQRKNTRISSSLSGLEIVVDGKLVEIVPEVTPDVEPVVPEKRPTRLVSSCANLTNVNPDYIPFVEAAADKWLGGDANILYALIQTESKWDASAKNRSSSASGLGQFINSTARAYPEFAGGSDVMRRGKRISAAEERIWEAGTIYDDPKANFPRDARFDPERSIYAVAHKMSGAIQGRSLLDAYAIGYHGFSAGNDKMRATAYGAGGKVVSIYKQLQKQGGCQVLELEV